MGQDLSPAFTGKSSIQAKSPRRGSDEREITDEFPGFRDGGQVPFSEDDVKKYEEGRTRLIIDTGGDVSSANQKPDIFITNRIVAELGEAPPAASERTPEPATPPAGGLFYKRGTWRPPSA